ncbi:MAG: histidine kinase [Treponema sp.]|nr:histidine kinase [Spirochaetia bacterium]MDD7451880.1 histidine kinase [Treponema sp.]MDY2923287.1 histidine kinase [Treponema sp.]MDY5683909.1 histidine kinase [Treponema sp.]
MKKLFAKIMNSKNNTSLRTQITGTILLSILLILFTILATTKLVLRTMDLTGNSYQTNADLDAYLKLIENTEASLESYIKFRTFEGIDKYYHYESAAQAKVLFFNEKSSNIPISQKKYIIRRLSESFFRFGDKAIDARRANNHKDTNYYMEKALQCYSFLTDEISSLTMLYFQTNAAQYESSKTYTKNLLQFSIFFMFTILIAAFFLLFIRITHIIQPLSSISAVAHKLADRDFNVPLFNNQSKNEIGHICRAFDCMIISIREYVDTIWEKALKENQLREKEIEMQALYSDARLKALQNQIKPHFLFNTLNTGAQLAMIEGADKTCYFLEQVADFFRYNQHTDRSATIQEELGMLDNYIYIMQTRFGDRFTFEKHIQKNLLNTKVPNMILQPLVENCIKHGLKDKIKGGIIEIKVAESENEIEISISDNGCGFHPEIKEHIFQAVKAGAGTIIKDMKDEEKEHHSTGLLNVISRLKLYYKKDNILQILSNPKGEGTMFLIRIPNV